MKNLKKKIIKKLIIIVASLSGAFLLIFGAVSVLDQMQQVLVATIMENSSNGGSLGGVEYQIYSFFKGKGFSDIQIASILGNWYQESRLDPSAMENKSGNILARGGIGLTQWTHKSVKENGLLLYVKQKNKNGTYEGWDNVITQCEFAYMCIDPSADRKGIGTLHWSSAIYNQWKNCTDVAKATELFCTYWERAGTPRMDVRISKAQEYLSLMKSGGLIGTGGTSGYVKWMIQIANDNKHGYSMPRRNFNPDVDCSSFVWYALKNNGYNNIGSSPFTTSVMDGILRSAGFKRYNFKSMNELKAGDILLIPGHHTEVYAGNGKNVGAHWDYDGKIGDSSGREVSVGNFTGGWTYYYRK